MAAARIRTSLTGLIIPQYLVRFSASPCRKLWHVQSRDGSSVRTIVGEPFKFRTTPVRWSRNASSSSDVSVREVSPILLRDLCSCNKCIDSSTRQKLFSTTEIPPNIRVLGQVQRSRAVEITWENDIPGWNEGHVSTIPLDIIHRIYETRSTTPSVGYPEKITWDDKSFRRCDSADVPYEEYMTNDRVLYKVIRQLYQYGLVFVQGVPESEESVSRIAERIGPLKNTFYGRTWDVRSVPQATNVAYTSQNLGFHMDLLYMQQPPHIQLLHCIRSSAAGGASLFTDSFKSAIDLSDEDPEAFKNLSKARVDFHYDHPGSQYYHQARTVVELNADGMIGQKASRNNLGSRPGPGSTNQENHIDAISWSPPFQAPFSAGLEDVDQHEREPSWKHLEELGTRTEEWHSDARKFDQLIHRPEVIHERMMKPGECVLFDNRRVLHARRAFEVGDLGKERWLRGAYIDKDPFMSQLKILQDRYDSTKPDDKE